MGEAPSSILGARTSVDPAHNNRRRNRLPSGQVLFDVRDYVAQLPRGLEQKVRDAQGARCVLMAVVPEVGEQDHIGGLAPVVPAQLSQHLETVHARSQKTVAPHQVLAVNRLYR